MRSTFPNVRFHPEIGSIQSMRRIEEVIGKRLIEGQLFLLEAVAKMTSTAAALFAFRIGEVVVDGLLAELRQATRVLEIGNSDAQDRCVYSDIDMVAEPGSERYRHRDGTPYPPKPG